jgi:hypothetical protein
LKTKAYILMINIYSSQLAFSSSKYHLSTHNLTSTANLISGLNSQLDTIPASRAFTITELLKATPLIKSAKICICLGCLFVSSLSAEHMPSNKQTIEKQSKLQLSKSHGAKDNDEQITKKNNSWSFVKPYKADYDVYSDGDIIGSSERSLSLSNNIWTLETSAQVSIYFLKFTSKEFSKFAIIDQQIRTLEFDSKTKLSFKKTKHMNQVFNWQSGIEVGKRGKKNWQHKHDNLVFDRVSHLIQLQADLLHGAKVFTYQVSYKGKVQEFQYVSEGIQPIETNMGTHHALKLTRKKSNGDLFIVWMSPELNYFPVQISQLEDDKPEITMIFKSLDYQAIQEAPTQKLE